MERVITDYMDDVRTRTYPGPEHTVYMKDEELEQFAKDMNWDNGLEIAEKRKSGSRYRLNDGGQAYGSIC